MAQILWLVLGLTTIVSGVLAAHHPKALLVGRIALGSLMLIGGAIVNAVYLGSGVDYDDFADLSMLAFVTDTWRDVVAPHQNFFIGLLIAFEAITGVLVYLGGRTAAVGMTAIIGFHLGLMFFGWGFWIWSIPMIAGVALLLRAQLRTLRQPTPAAPRHVSGVRATL
jgi:hypothetical protein